MYRGMDRSEDEEDMMLMRSRCGWCQTTDQSLGWIDGSYMNHFDHASLNERIQNEWLDDSLMML